MGKIIDSEIFGKNSKNFIKIIYFFVMVSILIVQLYLVFFALPEHNKVFKECEMKVLCEYGELPSHLCYGYEYEKRRSRNPVFDLNITPMIEWD